MMLARDKMSHIGREVEDSFRHSFDRQFGDFDRQMGVFQQRINQQFGNIGNLGNGLLSPGGGGGWPAANYLLAGDHRESYSAH